MTEREFNELVYENFAELSRYDCLDAMDAMWVAAMRVAMAADRDAVRAHCSADRPLQERERMQVRQFAVYRKIAMRERRLSDVDVRKLCDQFVARTRKERKR